MEGTNDALTLDLDTLEHRGRIRGIEAGVTPTSYFHTPTPYRWPKKLGHQKELDNLQKQWDAKFQAQEKKFQATFAKMQAQYENVVSG